MSIIRARLLCLQLPVLSGNDRDGDNNGNDNGDGTYPGLLSAGSSEFVCA